MDFPDLSEPRWLWLLSLLPLLWWFSLPVRPRQLLATAHLEQWLRARARLRRRRVRWRWLRFLLLAVAFGCVTVAAARPRLPGMRGAERLAVLLDASASMAAVGANGRSAAEEAAAELKARLDSLPASLEVSLAICGREVEVVRGDPASLAARLSTAPRAAGVADLATLAQSLADDRTAVWTLTDALGPTEAPQVGALTLLGAAADNVAITGCRVDDRWPLPDLTVALTMRNCGRTDVRRVLRVEGLSGASDRELELPAGRDLGVDLRLQRGAGGRAVIALTGGSDPLPLDDHVELEVPPAPAPVIAVLRDQEAGPWIDAIARALAEETGGRIAGPAEPASLVLADGGIYESRAGPWRGITFGTRSENTPLRSEQIVVRPVLVDWERSDPLTSGLDLSELAVTTCLAGDFGGAGRTLIAAEHGPLAVATPEGTQRRVHFSFRLADSNLPRLAAFPQLVRRAFAHAWGGGQQTRVLGGNPLDAAESTLQAAGSRVARPLPRFAEPGAELAVAFLIGALLLLALRVYS
jgi:hypothetical protein